MRYFKCNILGGFRLSDLNKNFKQGEYFSIDNTFCDTSRAAKAALQSKWMTEVSEKEASEYITIPGKAPQIRKYGISPRSLESRQAERTFKRQATQRQKEEDKPVLPDFNEAEKKMKIRQADVMTKGADEVLQSPVTKVVDASTVKDLAKEIADNDLLSTPNFDEKADAPIRRRRKTLDITEA